MCTDDTKIVDQAKSKVLHYKTHTHTTNCDIDFIYSKTKKNIVVLEKKKSFNVQRITSVYFLD